MFSSINRCSVCESRTRIIAVHSQSMDIPDCPHGWEELWLGYSYLMVKTHPTKKFVNEKGKIDWKCFIFQSTTDNTGGFGQNLISPGSCLEEFRSQPVIECHGHGRCNYYDQLASFWLAVIDEDKQFRKPEQQTLKSDQTSKISRYAILFIWFLLHLINDLLLFHSCSVCRKIRQPKRHTGPPQTTSLPPAEALVGREAETRNSYYPPQQQYNSNRYQPPPPPRRTNRVRNQGRRRYNPNQNPLTG